MYNILIALGFATVPGYFSPAQNVKNNDSIPGRHPVFQVDYSFPTADKPQSKVWYMDECWWALLPASSGPALWQRSLEGRWKEHTEVAQRLQGVPGRADVWPGEHGVTAVGVAEQSLTVFRIAKETKKSSVFWKCEVLAELHPPSPGLTIETATIARDSRGEWWVAAVAGTSVFAWSSTSDGSTWTQPVTLTEGIDEDDICTVTRLPDESIGVIWSDQVRQAVVIRRHIDGTPFDEWKEEEIIDEGNNTADDHLNASLSSGGTLWLATKNSVDQPGEAQFVLRIRSIEGKWINKPYLLLEKGKKPSRPIVATVEGSKIAFTGHGDNDRTVGYPHNSEIIFGLVDTTLSEILVNPKAVIAPDKKYNSFVQNVTGPKKPFPPNAPWIILASDPEGRVYEADLKKLLNKKLKDNP